jgi:hypothetical protein
VRSLSLSLYLELTGQQVPDEYLKKEYTDSRGRKYFGASACAAQAFDPFREDLIGDNYKAGWENLMKYDWASTRSYLAREMDPKYPLPAVHWMETRNSGTGGYDHAFSEASTSLSAGLTSYSN